MMASRHILILRHLFVFMFMPQIHSHQNLVDLQSNSINQTNNNTLHFHSSHPILDEEERRRLQESLNKLVGHRYIKTLEIDNEENYGISSYQLKVKAEKISDHLKKIIIDDVGFNEIQASLDTLPVKSPEQDYQTLLREMGRKMESKLLKYRTDVLERSAEAVRELHSRFLAGATFSPLPCLSLSPSSFKFSEHFSTDINSDTACDLLEGAAPPEEAFLPGVNLTEVFGENLADNPTIKWQLYTSREGRYQAQFPSVFWPVAPLSPLVHYYTASRAKAHRWLVVAMDHGSALSSHQMELARAMAKLLLASSLGTQDQVALLAVAGEVMNKPVSSAVCGDVRGFVPATPEMLLDMLPKFVDSLSRAAEPANHVLAFQRIFELLLHNLSSSTIFHNATTVTVAYISRGLLSSLAQARDVMAAIALGNGQLNYKVVINTYVLAEERKPLMYEKAFLQNVAAQNFSHYGLPPPPVQPPAGAVTVVEDIQRLRQQLRMKDLCGQEAAQFSLPVWDSAEKGIVTHYSLPVVTEEQGCLGTLSLQVDLLDLAEDVLYLPLPQGTHAFLTDIAGLVLVHPSLPREDRRLRYLDISHLEQTGFQVIRDKILREAEGREELAQFEGEPRLTTYLWHRVGGTPYILCLVSQQPHLLPAPASGDFLPLKPSSPGFLYHRLDLMDDTMPTCRYFHHLATLESSTVFLGPSSFLSPARYRSVPESRPTVQGYMAYLADATRLIANPGLKPGIRPMVLALARISARWKATLDSSEFIVRRYCATSSGILLVYPGMVLPRGLEPHRRDWFLRAVRHPGSLVLTSPYLDLGGAGYVVTLARMLDSSGPDQIVVALDLTLGYLQKIIISLVPFCEKNGIECFVLDQRGYLVAHRYLLDPQGQGPIEQQHVTHREPLLACDLLSHRSFMDKQRCRSLADRTLQRYYHLNTSLPDVLSNLVHGDPCTKYKLTSIPNTNLFFAVVKKTCESVTAFCPCSMVDRLCLNCHRMEQTECECPCECPQELCTDGLESQLPLCPTYMKEGDRLQQRSAAALRLTSLARSLEDCRRPSCHLKLTEKQCLGVVGCEWCQLAADGATPLVNQYCVEQPKCFGGVLGSPGPYAGERLGLRLSEEMRTVRGTPVGPVAGGIMAVFLSVAIGVYCYRHHQAAPLGGEDMPPPPLLCEEPPAPAVPLAGGGYEPSVSPYRINPGYRRPAAGGDFSDHGYSTMTQPEESEHLSTVEPPEAIVAFPWDQTSLPPAGCHHILAPVQVHMVAVD